MGDAGMIIIGAGEAGARAALALREQGWPGPITLIGDEPHAPYERPPLSKAVMTADAEPAPPTTLDATRAEAHGIDLLCGCPATAIDRGNHRVLLQDGRRLSYRKLLLATGARARRLGIDGAGRLLYLRSFADAVALRDRLRADSHIAIIGGGFIGLELAASATTRGCRVTVIEVAPRCLMRGVPAEIAAVVVERHRAAGVDLRTGSGITTIAPDGGVPAIVLADGSRVACDVVIAGVGAVPETALAEACELDIENGIRVDGELRTSDPDIFAAGDCCSFPHPLYGGRRIRLEAWRNAQEQGAHAARTMLGIGETYAAVPSFWSDQYELTLRIAGLPDAGLSSVTRELGDGARLYFHLDTHGRLMAASGIGADAVIAKEIRLAEMLIARQARTPPDDLSNPEVRLKSLLRA
jgi:3-phenylpropionate/trans-cinnamate dioxygenase ferredoxin reductase component